MNMSEMPQKSLELVGHDHAVDAILAYLANDGARVDLPDLGALFVRTYEAYEGRNPRTGEVVHVPAKRLLFFLGDNDPRGAASDDEEGQSARGHIEALEPMPASAPVTALAAAVVRSLGDDRASTREVLVPRLGTFRWSVRTLVAENIDFTFVAFDGLLE